MAESEKKVTVDINEVIVDFFQKHRKKIIIFFAAAAAALAALTAVTGIGSFTRKRALSTLQALEEKYEGLRIDLNDPAKDGEIRSLLDELNAFGEKNAAFAGGRACHIAAQIHADRKNWEEAEKAWIAAARKAKNTYLAPVALFNAAVAAEEQDHIDGAIALYTECLAYGERFPAAPRAQFAVGRLREEQQDREAALAAYRTLIDTWPAETVWINLANSRIISIGTSGS
jgi:tetratricopeptide (TPR) repeat protein